MKEIKKFLNDYSFQLILFLIFIILFVIIKQIFKPIYISSDDIAYKNFLCGNKTGVPEAHLYFIQYPLSYILSILFKLKENIDWYGNFLLISNLCSIYFILIKIKLLKPHLSLSSQLMILIIIVYLFAKSIMQLEWTFTAVLLCLSGIFYLFGDMHEKDYLCFKYIPAYILIFLGMNLRLKIFYMTMPIVLGLFLLRISNKKIFIIEIIKDQKQIIYSFLVIAVILASTLTINKFAYSSTQWRNYSEYTYYRSQIWDYYGLPSYSEYTKEYEKLGIDQQTYQVLKYDYSLLLTKTVVKKEKYKDLYEFSKRVYNEEHLLSERILTSFETFYNNILSSKYFNFNIIIIFLYIFINIEFISKRQKLSIIINHMILLLYLAVIYYFVYINRYPERVISSLLLCVICFLCIQYSNLKDDSIAFNYSYAKVFNFGLSILTIINTMNLVTTLQDNCISYTDRDVLVEFYNENSNNIYLRDFYSFNVMSEYIGHINEVKTVNELTVGGWNVRTPIYEKQMVKLGAKNIDELLNKDNIYYIVDRTRSKYSVKRLRSYLKRYNLKITIYSQMELPSGKKIGIYKIYK